MQGHSLLNTEHVRNRNKMNMMITIDINDRQYGLPILKIYELLVLYTIRSG
jgi:hypothetical protein